MDQKYLYLEEVEGASSLKFAKEQTDQCLQHFQQNHLWKSITQEVESVVLAQDRLPQLQVVGRWYYQFWQDEKNPQGIWRRCLIKNYCTGSPGWELLINLDELIASENKKWSWKYVLFCKSKVHDGDSPRAMIFLSDGGKDAVVGREFDLQNNCFVTDGFVVPEGRTNLSWINENEVAVAADFGSESLSVSGFPIQVRHWVRGTELNQAKVIYRGSRSDAWIDVHFNNTDSGANIVIYRALTFYTFEVHTINIADNFSHQQLQLPIEINPVGQFGNEHLVVLRKDWNHSGRHYLRGSLIAVNSKGALSEVFRPTKTRFLNGSAEAVHICSDRVFLDVLDDIQGQVLMMTKDSVWTAHQMSLPSSGVSRVMSSSTGSSTVLILHSDFLIPNTIIACLKSTDSSELKFEKIFQGNHRFDADAMQVQRKHAISEDGTKIPFFMVHRKDIDCDGKNPTYINAYGGFEVVRPPFYLGDIGKVWLARGGVFVLANIRGGGEYGPDWHQSVIKENRHKVFADLIAVGEKLIEDQVTSSENLGIQGGSNGGLLVGATFVKRPDLFNAVLCEVPLLDMLRFHKLLAGALWVGEYGDPDDESNPEIQEAIRKYSPFQNVKPGIRYPEVFFLTSTKDDRVHPGHARKMAAKMLDQGHRIHYYENQEGGHAGTVNPQQLVLWRSLCFTYLFEKLGRS